MVADGSFLDGKVPESFDHSLPHPAQSNTRHRSCRSGNQQPGPQSVMSGPPPIRRPLAPLLSQEKAKKTQPSSGQQTPKPLMGRKSSLSTGRRSSSGSSASSSTSTSSPKAGSSPNGSFHQISGQDFVNKPHPPPPSPLRPPVSGPCNSRKASIVPEQTPMPQPSQQRLFHSTPAVNACSCCASRHGHSPVYPSNTWQGTPFNPAHVHMTSNNPIHCPTENSPHGECCESPARHSLGCHGSPTRSPVCHASVPLHCSPSHGPRVPVVSPSGGVLEQPVPASQAQCCQLQLGCTGQPGSATFAPLEGSMGLLPADAYRMLVEQDRQLKQLQAQVCFCCGNFNNGSLAISLSLNIYLTWLQPFKEKGRGK